MSTEQGHNGQLEEQAPASAVLAEQGQNGQPEKEAAAALAEQGQTGNPGKQAVASGISACVATPTVAAEEHMPPSTQEMAQAAGVAHGAGQEREQEQGHKQDEGASIT